MSLFFARYIALSCVGGRATLVCMPVRRVLHQGPLRILSPRGKPFFSGQVPISHCWNSKTVTEGSAETSSTLNAFIGIALGTTSDSLLSVLYSLFSANHSQQVLQGEEVVPAKREPPVPRGGADQQPVIPPVNQPPPSSITSAHRPDVDPQRPQCPAWNDGYCSRGRNCKMLHIPRVIMFRRCPRKQPAHYRK